MKALNTCYWIVYCSISSSLTSGHPRTFQKCGACQSRGWSFNSVMPVCLWNSPRLCAAVSQRSNFTIKYAKRTNPREILIPGGPGVY